MKDHYEYLFCGGGPSTIGFLTGASARNDLALLCRRGLGVLERENRIGGGAFKRYRFPANSGAQTFLQCIEGSVAAECFSRALSSKWADELRALGPRPPMLFQASHMLDWYGKDIARLIGRFGRSQVIKNCTIQQINQESRSIWKVFSTIGDKRYDCTANNIFLNLGAHCDQAHYRSIKIFGTYGLGDYWAKVLLPDALLTKGVGTVVTAKRMPTSELTKILIVGSSHTAFTIAQMISNQMNRRYSMTILAEHYPSFYFDNFNDAVRYGYTPAPSHICPITGNVNRFSGLRFKTARFASHILRGANPRCTFFLIRDMCSREVRALFDLAHVIIPCLGFQPKMPRIMASELEADHISQKRRRGTVHRFGRLLPE